MCPTEWQIKDLFCEIGRRCWARSYVASNEGNFSCRCGENRVLATPTGHSKGFLKPEDIVTLDMDGNQVGGEKKPTMETRVHLEIYRQRTDIGAVIHAHPPYATIMAVVNKPLPRCVLPEVELYLGEIPLVEYATPGTQKLADVVKPFLRDFSAFLLASHGALTIGKDLEDAYFKMEIVEEFCRVLCYSKMLKGYSQISEDQVSEILDIKKRLGLPDRRLQPNASISCSLPGPHSGEIASENNPLQREVIESIVRKILREKGML